MSEREKVNINEWIEECINGHAGYKSFIDHENLGVYPADLALAGANWIIGCLAQPHAKDVLDAVNQQASKNKPPEPDPLQPGQRVWVEATFVRLGNVVHGVQYALIQLYDGGYNGAPLSAIHPAPQPAKKGE